MILSILFFLVALFYSMVGFGGGSSYIALLALNDVPYSLIPLMALLCNIIVVTGGVYYFYKKRLIPVSIVLPFIVGSVPMAYIGGQWPISKEVFYYLLSSVLLVAGLRVLFIKPQEVNTVKPVSQKVALCVGVVLGLISGLVGIGGGIFLTPILLNFKWAKPKQAAASASLFIFVNSLFGLLGQVTKHMESRGDVMPSLSPYVALFVLVFVGGQIGSRLGSGRLSPLLMSRMTAALVLFVGVRLFFKAL